VNFASDNTAGAAPEILAALAAVADGRATAYGDDAVTERLARRLEAVFERPLAAFPLATGTAANALVLSTLVPPWGAVLCHELAHANVDECGAPELFSGGAKLIGLPGADGKIDPGALARLLDATAFGEVHHVQPAALSLTQASERGTVYTPDEIRRLADLAHGHGLAVHMDGARLANAIARLGVSPAAITWQAGVDALSFGATKNGAIGAEAALFFDPARAAGFAFRRKRAGHLLSKMRFVSAQLEAYLEDGLWLRLAGHANAMAARLADGLAGIAGVSIAHPVGANMVFATLPETTIRGLEDDGFAFYRWPTRHDRLVRLVTAFDTTPAAVDALVAAARRHAGNRPN